MELLEAYIPSDRRRAMARNESLPDRTQGAVLFADMSGFTALTDILARELGPRRGADELTQYLNRLYEALIAEVHGYGGSIVGFSGDAITCWFDRDQGAQATACALALQQAMGHFATITTPARSTVSLAIKVIVTAGPARRFLVGDPHIQYIDVLAGATLDRMAAIENQAQKGEVLVGPEIIAHLGDAVQVAGWRRYTAQAEAAVVAGLTLSPLSPAPSSGPVSRASVAGELHLTETQVRPWLLPLVYERYKAGQGRFLAELRTVAALFLNFQGLEYDHDEAAGDKLDAYIRWVQNVLALYDGYLIQLTTGDKGCYFYAVFGAPVTHDDDASRAVAAALQLRSPPSGLNFITGIKIGLSQGRMHSGACGSSTRCTYGVLGDEVNIAARLMEQAEPGQILASKSIADGARNSHRFHYLGPIMVKGKAEPVPVFVALGRRRPAPRSSSSPKGQVAEMPLAEPEPVALPLVGREAELARLDQLLESTLAGAGQILRLEGEAGVGKSRLAAELVQQARGRGLGVALAACQSISQGIPYYPWRQLFRSLFGLADEPGEGADLAGWTAHQIGRLETLIAEINPGWLLRLPLLGDLLNLPIADNPTTAAFEPHLRREARLALAVEIIQAQAQAQPWLLLIEDVHWLDEASLALTMALARVLAAAPILLVLVQRPTDPPLLPDLNSLPGYHHLLLPELPPASIAQLATQRLQGDISTLALAFIQLQAQGNPFFAEELIDALREAGDLDRPAGGVWSLSESLFHTLRQAHCLTRDAQGQWTLAPEAPLSAADLGIPDSIHGLVLSRLDRLPGAHKLTLKVASVIGPAFDFEVLAQTHPAQPDPAALLDQLANLQERDFIRPGLPSPLGYTFKHHITQEVAYEHLPADQQRELHRLVGETLERLRPEAVGLLAYHYSRSGVREKTLFYLNRAARKARREYANETALNYYNQALTLEERWEWREGQVEVLHLLGQREEERAGLERLEIILSRGREVREQGGEGEITPAPQLPSSSAVFETAYLWGQYYEAIGRYAEAEVAVTQALKVSQESGDLASEISCLAQLGLVAFRQGNYEHAKRWYNQALALFQPEETYSNEVTQALTQVFNGLGAVHSDQGAYEQAQIYYQQALILSRGSGDQPGEANTLLGLAVIAYYQHHFAKAQNYFQQVLAIRQVIGDRDGEGIALYNLAQVFTEAGDYSQAHKYFDAALKILQATDNLLYQIYIWNALGILYLNLGDLRRAQHYLEQGLQLVQQIGTEENRTFLLVNLGLVMQLQGKLAVSEQLLTEGLILAQAINNRRLVAAFLSYLSTVHLQAGRLEQAIEQATMALTLWLELGLRLYTTRDLTTLAAVHLALDEVTKALGYAEQVLSILEECGGEGPEFPERDYWIGYQVLMAAGQADRAGATLKAAYNLVMGRADKITDPALRQSFLEQVVVNREIVATYQQALIEDSKDFRAVDL